MSFFKICEFQVTAMTFNGSASGRIAVTLWRGASPGVREKGCIVGKLALSSSEPTGALVAAVRPQRCFTESGGGPGGIPCGLEKGQETGLSHGPLLTLPLSALSLRETGNV